MELFKTSLMVLGAVVWVLFVIGSIAAFVDIIKKIIDERSHRFKRKRIDERLSEMRSWSRNEHKELLDRYVVDFYFKNKDIFK